MAQHTTKGFGIPFDVFGLTVGGHTKPHSALLHQSGTKSQNSKNNIINCKCFTQCSLITAALPQANCGRQNVRFVHDPFLFFAVRPGPVLNYFVIILGSFWNHFWIISVHLASFWDHFLQKHLLSGHGCCLV